MFPEDTESYLENEEIAIVENETLAFNGQAFLYDYQKGDFVIRDGKLVELTGQAALEAWLEKLIRTEKFRFKIYEEVDYAVTLEDLIGGVWPKGFVEAEIKREITEAAVTNTYIEDLVDWSFERDGSYLIINFTVIVAAGSFEMEVAV
ncbi:MAG: DUF2634 domain-containing protein [Solibacillus sp.]|uniref:DUF2634 domain-containing protein n=1 Tax=Solibacillus sp. TaxID=1909654 RepID=UPI003314FCAB